MTRTNVSWGVAAVALTIAALLSGANAAHDHSGGYVLGAALAPIILGLGLPAGVRWAYLRIRGSGDRVLTAGVASAAGSIALMSMAGVVVGAEKRQQGEVERFRASADRCRGSQPQALPARASFRYAAETLPASAESLLAQVRFPPNRVTVQRIFVSGQPRGVAVLIPGITRPADRAALLSGVAQSMKARGSTLQPFALGSGSGQIADLSNETLAVGFSGCYAVEIGAPDHGTALYLAQHLLTGR